MKAIPWEDRQLTARQQEILIGSLLGDGRLECRSLQGSARFRVHHANSQRDLLFWKYEEFKNLVLKKPWCTDWLDRRYDRHYLSWFFHTKTSTIFTALHQQFYKNTVKHIPNHIDGMLTPLALAVWIADDGCRENDCLILNTQSFVLAEQKLLLDVLDKKYNIKGSINRDRNNFRLRFNRANSKKFMALVESFEIPILKSKFVPVTTCPA